MPGLPIQYIVDSIVVLVAIFAQIRMGRAVHVWVVRRYRVPGYLVTASLLAGGALLLAGFAAGYHDAARYIPLPRPVAGWMHGLAFLWCFSTTGAYYIYALWRLLLGGAGQEDADPSRRRLIRAAGGALAGTPFILTGFGTFVQRTDFRVREVAIPVDLLPEDLCGLRLVQLSDIHLSPYLSEREFASVIDASNELRPHLALVTGDMISNSGDPLEACLRQIARLRTDAGIIGCLGNHEVYAKGQAFATSFGLRLGIRFLRRAWTDLRFGQSGIRFAGVDYQRIGERETYLRGAERMVRPGVVNVLLSHNPDVFPVAARKGFDVTISGHTHGGQVQVEILNQSLNLARFLTPYVYGLYRENGRSAYVTRGIGTIGMPARIGAPPEIALLRLERSSGKRV